jgi:hypothetical protein
MSARPYLPVMTRDIRMGLLGLKGRQSPRFPAQAFNPLIKQGLVHRRGRDNIRVAEVRSPRPRLSSRNL